MVTGHLVRQRLNDDPRALPRLVTLLENGDPWALDALDAVYELTGQAHVVGITGPPGVGKSTLVASLVSCARESGRRVAVLAVDPTSPFTGGAVLGDRIRMMGHHADSGVFVRSMASRGRHGGLAWTTAAIVHLLDAAGFPIVFVETIGAGQDGTDIVSLADTVVVVQAPGLGDGVQAIKAGLLEVGDIVVVNKADQPGANDALRMLRLALAVGQPDDDRLVSVLAASASTGSGVSELMAAIDDHAVWLDKTGRRAQRREHRARTEVLTALRTALDLQLRFEPDQTSVLHDAVARVVRKEQSPRQAAEELVDKLK